jgi:Putative peptidoglycan binding domain
MKKVILLSCVVPWVLAVSSATAQTRGHAAPMARAPMQRAPMVAPTARAPIQRPTTLNSTPGSHRFNDFHRDHRFRRVIVFNNFGFGYPFFGSFPFYYPYSYYGYPYGGYGYPYGAYGYPYGAYGSYGYGVYGSYGYGAGYGGDAGSGSLVVEVQRRLARAGYYSGRIDGIVGSGTRRAIRAYERSHGLPVDGTINRRLLGAMGLA